MTRINKILSGSALAIAIGSAPLAALAETTAPQSGAQVQPQTGSQAAAVSNEKLDSFVMAMIEVADVRQTYEPRLQEAENDGERQKIADEGNAAIRERVDGVAGITFDEFAAIAGAAGSDPELGARIQQRLAAIQTE